MDLKYLNGFLHAFKIPCDNNGVLHGAAMLLAVFHEETAGVALTTRLSSKARSSEGTVKEGMLT